MPLLSTVSEFIKKILLNLLDLHEIKSNQIMFSLRIQIWLEYNIRKRKAQQMTAYTSNALQFKQQQKYKGIPRCEILSIVICLLVGITLIEAYFGDGIWNSIEKSNQHLREDPNLQANPSTLTGTPLNILFHLINEHLSFQQRPVVIKRLLQNNEGQNDVGSISKSVLIIIIIVFIALPFASLVLFGAIVLYRRCQDNQQHQQGFQQPAHIDIDGYKIDQIGPYLSNPNDQCPICLDKEVNIRTYCGHFFHGICLKAWYDKKTNDGRKMTCPVCVGTQINPVKIYCKKCYMSGKLDVIYQKTSNQKTQELSNFICNQCKDVGQTRSETLGKEVKKQQPQINDSNEGRMHSAQQLYVGGFI